MAAALAIIKEALEEKAAPVAEVDGLAAKVMAAPKSVRLVIAAILKLV